MWATIDDMENLGLPAIPRSRQVYEALRGGIMRGRYEPGQPLKPQQLADGFGVSLAVVREVLLQLVGEGLADRLPNRGFAVPRVDDDRWQAIAEARALVEPGALRLAVARGDLRWESDVRAAHHSLARTTMYDDAGVHVTDDWAQAHRTFHRTLLVACGNDVVLATFDRLWDASELARRWSVTADPHRDVAAEHAALEQAVLDRDPDRAAELLTAHLGHTAAVLRTDSRSTPQKGA
jgi:DNA-binding GntR family transcriptional regulator